MFHLINDKNNILSYNKFLNNKIKINEDIKAYLS